MSTRIRLEVERCHGTPPVEPMRLDLDGPLCTLGRNPENDFQLEDPDRVISGRHARIEIESGGVWLVDTSTNGTYLNHAPGALPSDQRIPLQDGDCLSIGHYEIAVRLIPEDAAAAPDDEVLRLDEDLYRPDHLGLPGVESGPPPDILALLGAGAPPPREAEPRADAAFADARALDPFLAGPAEPAEAPLPVQPRLTPAEHMHFRPPEAHPIPEDYDLLSDALLAAEPPPTQEPAPPPLSWTEQAGEPLAFPDSDPFEPIPEPADPVAAVQPQQEPGATARPLPEPPAPGSALAPKTETPPSPPVPSPPAPSPERVSVPDDALAAFLRGLGSGAPGAVADPALLLEQAGALLRELTAGLSTTMIARARFKSELRLGSVTTIRSMGNNPFKFSASTDEALERLLLRPNRAYLEPLDAAREAFEDIQAHEMAMIAGLRAALRALLARFEPSALESRMESASGLDKLLPMARKARYWDIFTETFGQVAADASEDFMQLFGEAFTRAYEDQVLRLAEARRRRGD